MHLGITRVLLLYVLEEDRVNPQYEINVGPFLIC